MYKNLLLLWLSIFSSRIMAGEADIVAVTVQPDGSRSWSFQVTLKHADSGWKHYADRWEILSPTGEILATRVLAHPHINEQPFTRGLSGIVIPDRLESITFRAHDKVHGYGGKQINQTWPP
jgi:hypothetical protein